MLFASQIESYRQDGFLILPRLFSPASGQKKVLGADFLVKNAEITLNVK